MRILMGLLLVVVALSSCQNAGRDYRAAVNSLFDPACAPDGSVVRIEISNTQGSFEDIEASLENCPWYKEK